MHVSNMSSHSYILHGSVCQLPATNETHSYTYLRNLSKKAYLFSCMKIGECMKSGSSPALNLATVTSHQSRESQNSRHDGSLRVTSNLPRFPLPWLAGMLNLERRQMATYCLHGSEPMRCSNISKLGVYSNCWQHLGHFEDARSDGVCKADVYST